MQTMMLLQQARFRAQAAQDRAKTVQDQSKSANKVVLQTRKEHVNMKINQVVVMYLDTDQIVRPVTPPDVSPVIGPVVLLLSFS